MSVPIATSPGRGGFGPQLALSYDSGSGNTEFGFGWSLSLPSITRKTDKGLPQYHDAAESDVFILSGAEDLVPELLPDGTRFEDKARAPGFVIHRYRPRIEGLFARIERWTRLADGDVHWRSISKDNILTVYGKDALSRIADPADPRRVFSWLICETRDDKGNAAVYEYKPEDAADVDLTRAHERNRGEADSLVRTANRYLKRIGYGNRVPLLDNAGHRPRDLTAAQVANAGWLFEVVFDYGEHDVAEPKPNDADEWLCRPDSFSRYRAGFEVRTYRLCRRVLMFHHFPDEPGVGRDCLVRSTTFDYLETGSGTFLVAIEQSGYRRLATGDYLKRSFPPIEFEYSQAVIGNEVRDIDPRSLEDLPYGVDGTSYQWVDLDGEGLSGILTEQGNAWFYKRNESALSGDQARFGATEQVDPVPEGGPVVGGRWQFLDLAGDGQADLVALGRPQSGFYERTDDEGWEPFRTLRSVPNLDWNDRNLRMIDLTGDGHADILIAGERAFTWHPSRGEEGFGEAIQVSVPTDEERGPRVVFADGTETVFLADFSGDGLTDIVRIRNGEVCYWPNLGYGRFGPKVTMDGAPWFDEPDAFDPRRLRVADIDGSGMTDLIYLGRNRARFWLNLSGNAWSRGYDIPGFPPVDNVASVAAVDLLGNGTTCLVWSSPLPGAARAPMKFLPLMAEGKPHLLVRTRNNLGSETRVRYAPSTYFYLKDEREGRPWITRLPFPVHVVERVETYDYIGRNRFVTRYAYHHGHFDGVEREFRGFGMVEQWDTEEYAALSQSERFPVGDNVDVTSHVPPVLTKTWFHTGVFLGHQHVSDFFVRVHDDASGWEYYREPGLTDGQARARLLPDSVLPAGLRLDEEREACRALKGSMLRQETYALDGTSKANHPYVVTEQNFAVESVQRRGANRHAVFFSHAREVLNHHYERDPSDPRVGHALTLEVDRYGNALKSLSIGYGRRPDRSPLHDDDRATQELTLVTYTENDVTNPIDDAIPFPEDYRTPLPCETRSYEVTGFALTGGSVRFAFEEFAANADQPLLGLPEIPYEQRADRTKKQKRLIDKVRILYRPDDLGSTRNDPLTLLPVGIVEPLALPGDSYKLAFTPGLLAQVFRRDGQQLLSNPANVLGGRGADGGGYVSSQQLKLDGLFPRADPDNCWWIPAGRTHYSPNSQDTPVQELAHARRHFFLPCRYRDPFHTQATSTERIIIFDTYDLLMLETQDPLGNRVTVGERLPNGELDLTKRGNDYRVLQPWRVTDPNGNRSQVAYDALGRVVGSAIMGKPPPHPAEGDSLEGFDPDLVETVVLEHLAHPLVDPQAILGHATVRMVYDLFACIRTRDDPAPRPVVVYTLSRETHDADLLPQQKPEMQHGFSYSDGFGREIQKKAQAEPGPVPRRDANGKTVVDADGEPALTPNDIVPRWVGSGWTVFNNKGKPVRQYEPFFTDTHRFEFDVRVGVSRVRFYDPVERVVATLHANHAWEKVVFTPWQQVTWDISDTVLVADPGADADVGECFRRLKASDYLPTWNARRKDGALGPAEQAAASKAAVHAQTPAIAHADSLGRTFLTVAHNKLKYSNTPPLDPPTEEFQHTRVILDVEGNQREVIDAKDRSVMRYDYDMLGNRVHQASMDTGERWMLKDAAGKPLMAWDCRENRLRNAYDPLRRPTGSFLREGAGVELLVGRTVYGETQPNPEANNLRERAVRLFDQAGVIASDDYDFKGNLRRAARQLALNYGTTVDWSGTVSLAPEIYTTHTRYDGMNRRTALTTPDNSVIRFGYNEANLLDRIDVNLRGLQQNGQPVWTTFVADINYDAKGQRTLIVYGNAVRTTYTYDRLTFRLVQLITRRDAVAFPGDCPQLPAADWPGCQVQNLHYTYDPVGNITSVRDDAQQTVFFLKKRIDPSAEYTYDANYRLVEARGREHLGQDAVGNTLPPGPTGPADAVHLSSYHPNDRNAMGRYLQQFIYDSVGNIVEMRHYGGDPSHPGWSRTYVYDESSLIESAKKNNRLSTTQVGGAIETYRHDAHGNMIRMPHLGGPDPTPNMLWDYRDQLHRTGPGGDGTSYYVYDAYGQRVCKVWEKSPGLVDERIYLGNLEIFRKRDGTGAIFLERETLHVMDDKQRIAMVETRTIGASGDDPAPDQLIRYQFGNHLGSAVLELDDQARIISYEEYYPYGSTSYQAVRSQVETPKRYRYTGKERDEESGLYYHGARYYAPWLGRWVGPDPAGLIDALNLYQYSLSNPVTFHDPTGMQTQQGRRIVLPHRFTGKETVEELHQFARKRGYDFEGNPRWTGRFWDVGTLHHISAPEARTEAQSSVGAQTGGQGREPASQPASTAQSQTPGGSPHGTSSALTSFGRGFLKGLVIGIGAGLVIGAMFASGGTLAIVASALAVGGAGMGGLAIGQVITGQSLSGSRLTSAQRFEMTGELLGGAVGGAIGGGIGSRGISGPTAPSEAAISNEVIGKPRVGSALKSDTPRPTRLPSENYGRPAVREFGPQAKGHGFPDIVDNYAGDAAQFDLGNGARLYQLEGSQNGVPGRFEWITQNGNVTHRQFVHGGRINGVPTKP